MVEVTGKLSALLPELEAELAAVVLRLRQSVVVVYADGRGIGSGVVWADPRLVITNHHVLRGGRAGLLLADGRLVAAHVVARDAHVDLAALWVPVDLQPAPVRDSTDLRVGEVVLAVGNPLGLRGAVTAGIVGGVGPLQLDGQIRQLVRADVVLLPGCSGGPLADSAGRVVGVNAMVVSPGIGLAVPSATVARFVSSFARGRPDWN